MDEFLSLLTVSQLYQDEEMVMMKSCGIQFTKEKIPASACLVPVRLTGQHLSYRAFGATWLILSFHQPGCVAQLVVHLTHEPEVLGLIPSPTTFHFC